VVQRSDASSKDDHHNTYCREYVAQIDNGRLKGGLRGLKMRSIALKGKVFPNVGAVRKRGAVEGAISHDVDDVDDNILRAMG